MTYFRSPSLTDWHKQIIMGTVLGGSSIVRPSKGINCYLFMRSKNRSWLNYKAAELKEFCSQQPFTDEGSTIRWHSNCYPIFNQFREAMYVGSDKVVTMEILDQLRDIGLAIWYGDCGRYKNGEVILNTHKFGEKGTGIIARYFNEVGFASSLSMDRKSYRLLINKNGSERFLATIADSLPDCMHDMLVSE